MYLNKQTYKQLLRCIRLPSVRGLCAVLLTCKVAFAVTDAATSLKLVEYGMPKEVCKNSSTIHTYMTH
jgi:MFS transporter, PAT family, solute carrier family 33 (acetyl-CoA transportor), member 1